jgi:uncharacterized protein YecE (DUF72 family)
VPPARYVGCAGWSLPRTAQSEFPADGTHLARYAARFNATEINTTFYRPHRRTTYARWADSVPEDFAFSVKLPRLITHELRLLNADHALAAFADETAGLGPKLGCILIQLAPSLEFTPPAAVNFLKAFREHFATPAVLEARNASWFTDAASEQLGRRKVGRVYADPPALPLPIRPRAPINYFRMHGSPRMYYSPYDTAALVKLARLLTAADAGGGPSWCIFDNTALGHATADALALQQLLK